MKYRPRIYYTETDKALMWDRWQKGDSLHSIAGLFDRSHGSIAASLGRAPSTVSREINRNGGRRDYRASKAEQAAWDRAHRPKTCKLAENRALARIVASKLQLEWAPR